MDKRKIGGRRWMHTPAIRVFCRPTPSARRPIAILETLLTALLMASRRLPVECEYERTDTEYDVM
jgi:hypothetical protein